MKDVKILESVLKGRYIELLAGALKIQMMFRENDIKNSLINYDRINEFLIAQTINVDTIMLTSITDVKIDPTDVLKLRTILRLIRNDQLKFKFENELIKQLKENISIFQTKMDDFEDIKEAIKRG